jgi:hypothetical protein
MCYRNWKRRERGIPKRELGKIPECHPARDYFAKDMCRPCYNKNKYIPRIKTSKQYLKYNFRYKYDGLTLEEFENQERIQDYKCLICRNPETRTFQGRITRLVVDHDHKTGVLRGLLCSNCNKMLGFSLDNITTLLNAIKYLEDGVDFRDRDEVR